MNILITVSKEDEMMNVIWSRYVQGIKTLYYSRQLRFDDKFARQYKEFFALDESKPLKILEIGCGPGALSGALHRWYPNARITAIDRDSDFIRFAKENEPGITFIEGDATALPFDDGSFDVTISNTVSEHIEPSAFFGEQHRVLKQNGVCFVLSSRKGINLSPACYEEDEYEKAFWEKVSRLDDSAERFSVCKYPMTEAQLPATMEAYGFSAVSCGYATADLTPDDPKYSPEMALKMINALRFCAIEAAESVLSTMPDNVTAEEIDIIKAKINKRYDKRIEDRLAGKKYWETNLSLIMTVRGTKL